MRSGDRENDLLQRKQGTECVGQKERPRGYPWEKIGGVPKIRTGSWLYDKKGKVLTNSWSERRRYLERKITRGHGTGRFRSDDFRRGGQALKKAPGAGIGGWVADEMSRK